MAPKKPEPTVPLQVAEMLYVTLATYSQSTRLDPRTRDNLNQILKAYRSKRDMHCHARGYDDAEIKSYQGAAAQALADWLEDRADKADVEDADFDLFEKDLNEPEAQDPHQGSTEGGERTSAGDDGVGDSDHLTPTGRE